MYVPPSTQAIPVGAAAGHARALRPVDAGVACFAGAAGAACVAAAAGVDRLGRTAWPRAGLASGAVSHAPASTTAAATTDRRSGRAAGMGGDS